MPIGSQHVRMLVEWVARLVTRLDLATLSRAPRATWVTRVARRTAPQYADCWLLMDRDTEAHDNAEHLYRHLRQARPDINAWFVLSPVSADWPRLRAEGFRLIAHGSRQHTLALAQCHELVSSQVDHYVISPPRVAWLRCRPWWFTWLQHGVIQSDLSGWLNGKPVRTVISTTPAEHRSLTNPPYRWSEREVVLTGQPRHDALERAAAAAADFERTLVVVMPTWRRWLVTGLGTGNRRAVVPDFAASPYARNWLALLRSEAVAEVIERHGLQLVLMPHPNMAPHVQALDLPEHVQVATYAEDVQAILAKASHVVTDYSSIAFDAALVNRPVMYFQFDSAQVHAGGGHLGRAGYFDYARDGFGPVETTPAGAERTLVGLIEAGLEPAEPYATRARESFPMRGGGACDRVTEAILAHRRPPPGGPR